MADVIENLDSFDLDKEINLAFGAYDDGHPDNILWAAALLVDKYHRQF